MWEPQHLTTLWASTACYRDSFTFTFYYLIIGLCVLGFCVHTDNSVDFARFLPRNFYKHVSGHYPPSYFYLKTQHFVDWFVSVSETGYVSVLR
jgi:hypothetical protein